MTIKELRDELEMYNPTLQVAIPDINGNPAKIIRIVQKDFNTNVDAQPKLYIFIYGIVEIDGD